MPPASPQYTLVGFTSELDWRPWTFLKPVHAYRVCSACGLVRKTTVLLPCMHVLCESCYEVSAQNGLHVCPLDGNRYEERDVDIKEFPNEDLLSRKVMCWNVGNGCQYTTAASGIALHFERACEHHSLHCPKCSATVLCKNVCAHLSSPFCNKSTLLQFRAKVPPRQQDEPAFSTSFEGNIERKADEIAAYLSPMALVISAYGDSLNELAQGMNTLQESLRQELRYLKRHIRDSSIKMQLDVASSHSELKEGLALCSDTVNASLRTMTSVEKTLNNKLNVTPHDVLQMAASVDQVKAEVRESVQNAFKPLTYLLRHSAAQVTQCEFLVDSVTSLQGTAIEKGWAEFDSQTVYLRGYCMSRGVWLLKVGNVTTLAARYTLHKGDMDHAVVWPFGHKIRVSVIHPAVWKAGVLEVKPSQNSLANQKPKRLTNPPVNFLLYFYLPDLVSNGYVDNDQLRIKWELLS